MGQPTKLSYLIPHIFTIQNCSWCPGFTNKITHVNDLSHSIEIFKLKLAHVLNWGQLITGNWMFTPWFQIYACSTHNNFCQNLKLEAVNNTSWIHKRVMLLED